MTSMLPITRSQIEPLFVEAHRLTGLPVAFLSPDGETLVRWPAAPRAHPAGGVAADCLQALAPMAMGLTPATPTLSWVCPHGIECAVSALFDQSVLVGSVASDGQPPEQARALTRLLRLQLQEMIDLQREMENLSREIARNYEELNLHYELSAKLGTHPTPGPVFQNVADQIRQLVACNHIAILLKEDDGSLAAAYAVDRAGRPVPPFRLAPGAGISGDVVRSGAAKIVCRVDHYPGFAPLPYPVTSLLSVPMITSGKVLGVINLSDKEGGDEFSTNELKLLETIARQAAIALENARLFAEVRELFLSTVKSLASAIDAKDPYTHGHSLRVAYYSTILADGLHLTPEQREEVYLAAVLHDVGKIAVPESILLKPSALNEDEWVEMKQHPLHSAEILSKVRQFASIAHVVRHEHERYDGSGYPDRLTAEGIPLASRIIAVADAYDAMTTSRSYRQGMPPEQALLLLSKSVGTQFDPKVFASFKAAFEQGRLTLPPDVPTQLMMD